MSKAHKDPPSAHPEASGDPETNHAPQGSDGAGGKKKSKKRPSDDDAVNAEATHAEEEASLTELLNKEGGKGELHKAFWQFCLNEDPDALLLRFLRARKWNVNNAFSMLASTLKWRMETNLLQILAAGEQGLCKEEGVVKNFKLGKTYYRGTDREGR